LAFFCLGARSNSPLVSFGHPKLPVPKFVSAGRPGGPVERSNFQSRTSGDACWFFVNTNWVNACLPEAAPWRQIHCFARIREAGLWGFKMEKGELTILALIAAPSYSKTLGWARITM